MRALSARAVKDSLLTRFSKETLSAAAGAIGTAVVAGIIYLLQLSYQYVAADNLVGLIQQEPEPRSDEKSGNGAVATSYCILPGSKSPSAPTAPANSPDVELWKLRTFVSSASASVTNQDGIGSGEFAGYKISRNGSVRIDTIVGGFKGDVSGRGVYFLQRKYDMNGKIDQDWWRGYHTYFDCTNNRVLRCHYILGYDKDRASMLKDPWLSGQCAIE